MLVVMRAQATEEQVRAVCQKIESLGYRAHSIPGAQRTAIGITGNKGEVDPGALEELAGVQEVIRVSKPYKLVSRDTKPDNSVIKFAGFPGNDAAGNGFCDCRAGGAGGGAIFSGRSVQATDFSLFVSGNGGGWAQDHGRGAGALWVADRDRSGGL